MEKDDIIFEKQLKILRFAYVIYGIFLFLLSLVGIISNYFWVKSQYLFQPVPVIYIWSTIFTIFIIISGIILIFTYFGLKSEKKYARFTGITGCTLPILTLLLMSFMTGGYYFDISHLLIWIPSIGILLLTLYLWQKIPSRNNIQVTLKTKKIIVGIIIGIILVGVLFIVIPNTQKHFALNALEYIDYENGWGFNPPEKWQIDDKYYPMLSLSPPLEDNVSDKVFLGLSIGTTSSDIDEIGQKQLEEFENDFWINNTKNFSIISNDKKTINNMDSYEIVFSYEPIYENGTVGQEMKIENIVVVKGNKAIVIRYSCLSIYYETYESDIEQSLSSLTLV